MSNSTLADKREQKQMDKINSKISSSIDRKGLKNIYSYLDPEVAEKYKYTIKSMHIAASSLTIVLRERYPFYAYAFAALKEPIPSTFGGTAFTEGLNIYYNPVFMSQLTPGQVNWVLLHEALHILLLHRTRAGMREHERWNIAADEVVNGEIYQMMLDEQALRESDELASKNGQPKNRKYLELEMFEGGVYLRDEDGNVDNCRGYSAESLYGEIREEPEDNQGNGNQGDGEQGNGNQQSSRGGAGQNKRMDAFGPSDEPLDGEGDSDQSSGNKQGNNSNNKRTVYKQRNQTFQKQQQNDLIYGEDGDDSRAKNIEQKVKEIIRKAADQAKKQRGTAGSGLAERIIDQLKPSRIKWNTYLKRFFTLRNGLDASWHTPERKYLPFDLILPGAGDEEKLESAWFFVDSSGSVINEELVNFLNQAYTICKDNECTMNVAYWDTEVTEVYEGIDDAEKIAKAVPKHSGGTDIQCVYSFIENNKAKCKDNVFIICTDGFCGYASHLPGWIKANTIIALSEGDSPDLQGLANNGKLVDLF